MGFWESVFVFLIYVVYIIVAYTTIIYRPDADKSENETRRRTQAKNIYGSVP